MNIPLWVKHRDLAIHQAQAIAHAVQETDSIFKRPTRGTAGGDRLKIRGLPAVGVGGAIPGEGELAALMQLKPHDELQP
jgi:hypothetical protein